MIFTAEEIAYNLPIDPVRREVVAYCDCLGCGIDWVGSPLEVHCDCPSDTKVFVRTAAHKGSGWSGVRDPALTPGDVWAAHLKLADEHTAEQLLAHLDDPHGDASGFPF